MVRASPLLSFELQRPTGARSPPLSPSGDPDGVPRKPFYHYIPLLVTVLLILSPHPSLLLLLVKHHHKTLHQPSWALAHLLATYLLTFTVFSALIVCVARDPGPVGFAEALPKDADDEGDMSLAQALMAPADDEDFNSPEKWCRRCWAPKPERAHHCSACGRCVLKMDHHCPWIGAKCIGHRTYPAFVHFLGCITLLALYIAAVACRAVWWAFNHPFEADEVAVIHGLILSALGIVFTMVIGSFFAYHLYLISTNQTTLENISPFLLLRHLPPLPLRGKPAHAPDEDALSYAQRRRVRKEHGRTRLYDVGVRRNWAQVFGIGGRRGWWKVLARAVCGGESPGDGRTFPRNARADDALSRLAADLVSLDKEA